MDYKVGEQYLISCAEIKLKENGDVFYIPVFNHLHADPQFDFPHQHYHIDGRFEMHPRMRHHFNLSDGHTQSVIRPEDTKYYQFQRITTRQLECQRKTTGLIITENSVNAKSLANYEKWYQSYVGKKCYGTRCPHFGTEMQQRSGFLICPMHNLIANYKSLTIVCRRSVPEEISRLKK